MIIADLLDFAIHDLNHLGADRLDNSSASRPGATEERFGHSPAGISGEQPQIAAAIRHERELGLILPSDFVPPFVAPQRFLWTVFMVSEPHRECRVCQKGLQRRLPGHAGAVSQRPIRLRVRVHSFPAGRADAQVLPQPHGRDNSNGPLDGAGEASRSERCSREVAGHEPSGDLASTELSSRLRIS